MAVWPPLLAVAGPGGVTEPHRHHNLHAILAREGRLRATITGEPREAAGVITGPDVEHAVDATGARVVMLFLDPESVPGASLGARLEGGAGLIDEPTRDALLAGLSAEPTSPELEAWAKRAVDALTGETWTRPRTDPRVRRLLDELRELEPAETSLHALAERVGLSPSRLMHVFTESVGLPLRPYLRWLRVQRAAGAIVAGASLSRAAAEAGFSDAAHLSRTFKGMFGLPPSELQRRSRPGR